MSGSDDLGGVIFQCCCEICCIICCSICTEICNGDERKSTPTSGTTSIITTPPQGGYGPRYPPLGGQYPEYPAQQQPYPGQQQPSPAQQQLYPTQHQPYSDQQQRYPPNQGYFPPQQPYPPENHHQFMQPNLNQTPSAPIPDVYQPLVPSEKYTAASPPSYEEAIKLDPKT